MTRNGSERHGTWRAAVRGVALILACCMAGHACRAAEDPAPDGNELQVRWEYLAEIQVSADKPGELLDVLLDPRIFTHARVDLGDLRLYDGANRSVPYALRVRQTTFRRDLFPAKEFNRATKPDGSTELMLDLQRESPEQQPVEHNELEIKMPGTEFRRHAVVDGSDDGATWSKLAETDLIRFTRGDQKIDATTVNYPPSRYRQLRVAVFPDKLFEHDSVSIEQVIVVRRVDVPGEMVTRDGQLGPREPVMADGGPGSAWIIDLGGDNVPCDRIEVDVDDSEFARDFHVEAGGPTDSSQRFQRVLVGDSMWQRRIGQTPQPLVATFNEVRASRLRLVVTDYRNPPLTIRAVRYSAPAREIVCARPAASEAQLRLFFGNPDAAAPNYDFARNLPVELPAPPARATLGAVETNPDFVPPPKPWTERWPWLIYVVLGAVSLVLAFVIVSLARSAIARHERAEHPTSNCRHQDLTPDCT